MTAMALKKKNNMKKGPFKMKSPAKFFAKLPKGKTTIQDFASAASQRLRTGRGFSKIRMKSPAKFGPLSNRLQQMRGKLPKLSAFDVIRNSSLVKNSIERQKNSVRKKSTGLRGHIKRLFS